MANTQEIVFPNFIKSQVIKQVGLFLLALFSLSGKSHIVFFGLDLEARLILLISLLFITAAEWRTNQLQIRKILQNRNFFISTFFLLFFILQIVVYGKSSEKSDYFINLLFLFFLNFLLFTLIRGLQELKIFLTNILLLSSGLMFLAILGFNDSQGEVLFWNFQRNYTTFSGIATTTTYSKIILLGAVSSLVLAYLTSRSAKRIVLFLYGTLMIEMSFLSYSMAAYLSFGFAILFGAILLLMQKRHSQCRKLLLFGVLVGIVGLLVVGPQLNQKFSSRMNVVQEKTALVSPSGAEIEKSFYDYTSVTLQDNSQRISLAIHALRLFHENKIFGSGWGNFQYFGITDFPDQELGYYVYPHNVFLEFLSQGGLIGFLLLALLLISIFLRIYRNLEYSLQVPVFSLYALGLLFASNFGGDYYDFFSLFFLTIFLDNTVTELSTSSSATPS
jgi:O-antigen ligase